MNYSFEKAVRYIADEIIHGDESDILKLIQRASEKFDLSPTECQHLIDIHRAEIQKEDRNVT